MMLLRRNRSKIFVVGRNKTGTTSLGAALACLEFRVGDQARAELLIEDWAKRDFRNIISYCKSADAFQDTPFSHDYTYQAVDQAFPGSKFILSVRSSSDEWYESLIRFHTKIVGKGRTPTAEDLKQHPYRRTGWLWRAQQLVHGIDEHSLYDKEIYTRHYEAHNRAVMNYFRHRPNDLLVINVSEPDSMRTLCSFLKMDASGLAMPHLNSSRIPETDR